MIGKKIIYTDGNDNHVATVYDKVRLPQTFGNETIAIDCYVVKSDDKQFSIIDIESVVDFFVEQD